MSGSYDPRSAVKALIDTAQRNQPRILSSNVPGLVDERGESYTPVPRPPEPIEGLCFYVAAIEDQTADLPDDFDGIEMSASGLKGHVRPDGGCCLGFFGNSRDNATVVYGDPLLPREVVEQVVLNFWQGKPKPVIEVVS